MYNVSAAIKNNDDSKNATADIFILVVVISGCNVGGVIYNNKECKGMCGWHYRYLRSISYLAFPYTSDKLVDKC